MIFFCNLNLISIEFIQYLKADNVVTIDLSDNKFISTRPLGKTVFINLR